MGFSGLLTLLDLNTITEALLITESFTTQDVYRQTIASNLTLPVNYAFEVLRIFLPVAGNYLWGKGLGFNDYYQSTLYPHIPWGLGSNVWAEQYAVWGWSGPTILVLILFSLLYVLNTYAVKWISTGKIYKAGLVVFAVAPFYFYIHRNDLLFQLGMTRNYLLTWLAMYLVTRYFLFELRKYLRSGL